MELILVYVCHFGPGNEAGTGSTNSYDIANVQALWYYSILSVSTRETIPPSLPPSLTASQCLVRSLCWHCPLCSPYQCSSVAGAELQLYNKTKACGNWDCAWTGCREFLDARHIWYTPCTDRCTYKSSSINLPKYEHLLHEQLYGMSIFWNMPCLCSGWANHLMLLYQFASHYDNLLTANRLSVFEHWWWTCTMNSILSVSYLGSWREGGRTAI